MESQSSTGSKVNLASVERTGAEQAGAVQAGAERDTIFVDTGAVTASPEERAAAGILTPGTLIGGAYKILTHIGQGGMGHVYRAKHIILKKDFALKVLSRSSEAGANWVRFQTEAKLIARLDHRNIVKVYNLGLHEDSLPYYAMDLLEGESLQEIVERLGPLGALDTIGLFSQVCDGLSYAHRHGIIHRDIKPANIMLIVDSNNKTTVKLLDFGIAKLSGLDSHAAQSLTAPGEIFGSPLYMSPEQCLGQKVDARSDIYSVGCAIFETLTGQTPFKGDTSFQTIIKHQSEEAPSMESVRPDLDFPIGFEQLVDRALKKRPEDRYQTMQEMLVDLERIKQGKDLSRNYVNINDIDDLSRNTVSSITHSFHSAPPANPQTNFSNESGDTENSKNNNLAKVSIWAACGLMVLSLAIGACFYFTSKSPAKKPKPLEDADLVSAMPKNAPLDVPGMTRAKKVLQEENPTSGQKSQKEEPETNMIGMPLDAAVDLVVDQRWNGKPFIVGEDVLNGVTCDKYYFGSLKLGWLSWKAGISPEGRAFPGQTVSAFGKVPVPRGALASYTASESISFDPNVVKGFAKNALTGLSVHGVKKRVDEILASSVHIKTIRAVKIGKSDASDKAIEYLNKFPELEALDLRESSISPKAIARLKRLKQIKQLNLREVKGCLSALPALAGSTNLQELRIGDGKISDEQINCITSLKNLTSLELNNVSLTDQQLAKLSSLPNLKKLETLGTRLTPKSLEAIAKFKQLQSWEMNTEQPSWKKSDCQKASKLLPRFRTKVVLDSGDEIKVPDEITKSDLDSIPLH